MTSSQNSLLAARSLGPPTWTRFSAEGDAVLELIENLSWAELASNIFTDRLLQYMKPVLIKEIYDKTAVFQKSHQTLMASLQQVAEQALYRNGRGKELPWRASLESFFFDVLYLLRVSDGDEKMSLSMAPRALPALSRNLSELLVEMPETAGVKRKIDDVNWIHKLGFPEFRPSAAMLHHWADQPLLRHSVAVISDSLNDNYRHFMFRYVVGLLKCFVEDSRTVDGKLKLIPLDQIEKKKRETAMKRTIMAEKTPRKTVKTERTAAPLDMNRHYLTTPIYGCEGDEFASSFVRAPMPSDMDLPTEFNSKNCLVYAVSTLEPRELLKLIIGKPIAERCQKMLGKEQRDGLRQQVVSLKLNHDEVLANLNPPWLCDDTDNYMLGNSEKLRASSASIFWRKTFNKVFGGLPEILPSPNAKQLVDVVLSAVSRWPIGKELDEAFVMKINARAVPFVGSVRSWLADVFSSDELDEIQMAIYSNINMFCVYYVLHFIRRYVALTTEDQYQLNYDMSIRKPNKIVIETNPLSSDSSMSVDSSELERLEQKRCGTSFETSGSPNSHRESTKRVVKSETYADINNDNDDCCIVFDAKNPLEPEIICLSSDEE